MRTVNIHEAKTNLSSMLQEIEELGESFLICRNGKPVANLVSHRKHDRTKRHPTMSKISITYDPTEDLSEAEWGEAE
ncbi:MAG: type II toxin-antitoxin system Phd/YefM family antitoxin [Planctomycetota bacterium]|nr:type II toxin-antitoxin system Phd/YefM family antitoxin [Planctomycetota bacterium]